MGAVEHPQKTPWIPTKGFADTTGRMRSRLSRTATSHG
jgi:hypothetical protein